jgi:chaperonin GroES
MIISPMGDNIIVKVNVNKDKTTESGIIIVQKGQEKMDRGKVVAVGTGRILNSGEIIKPSISEGNIVIFNSFAGSEIAVCDEKYLILKENDILAIINE